MRLDDGRVIPTFVRQALNGEDLTVHGEGEQTRSFCYVTDLINGLVALMESGVDEPLNIGNSEEVSILELAETVIELTDSESDVTHETRPHHDPSVRRPDLKKARSELGWEPSIGLDDGLQRAIDYFEPRV